MLGFSQDGEDSGVDTACLGADPGNLVCVDGLSCVRIRMAQFICGGYEIDTVGNQNGSDRVTESMRMDVRQVIGFAEFVQPIRDTVGMHHSAIIFCKNKTGVLPDITRPNLGA